MLMFGFISRRPSTNSPQRAFQLLASRLRARPCAGGVALKLVGHPPILFLFVAAPRAAPAPRTGQHSHACRCSPLLLFRHNPSPSLRPEPLLARPMALPPRLDRPLLLPSGHLRRSSSEIAAPGPARTILAAQRHPFGLAGGRRRSCG